MFDINNEELKEIQINIKNLNSSINNLTNQIKDVNASWIPFMKIAYPLKELVFEEDDKLERISYNDESYGYEIFTNNDMILTSTYFDIFTIIIIEKHLFNKTYKKIVKISLINPETNHLKLEYYDPIYQDKLVQFFNDLKQFFIDTLKNKVEQNVFETEYSKLLYFKS